MSAIPSTSLDKVCEFILDGTHGSPERTDVGVPVLSAQNVIGGELNLATTRFTSEAEYFAFKKRLDVSNGDVLLTIVGTIGRVAVVREKIPVVLQRSVAVLRPKQNMVDSRYLYHALCFPESRRQLDRFTNKSAQAGVYLGKLKSLEIPLPPLDEQRCIATILDKADAIRRKRQESILMTEEFLRSTFLEIFGDPVTNPKGWDKVPIKELGDVMTGNTPSREVQEYYGEGIEWIKSDNINTPFHFLTEAKEYLTPGGQKVGRIVPAYSTLVTCIAGSPECIGNAALANRPVAFNQQINAITPFKETDPYFLYVHILVSKKLIQGQSTESMKGMVSKGKFENISFFKPPIKLQEDFGKIFTHFHEMITKAESSNQESANLYNSLAQLAFQGEL